MGADVTLLIEAFRWRIGELESDPYPDDEMRRDLENCRKVLRELEEHADLANRTLH